MVLYQLIWRDDESSQEISPCSNEKENRQRDPERTEERELTSFSGAVYEK
jgi:hypothetical protein